MDDYKMIIGFVLGYVISQLFFLWLKPLDMRRKPSEMFGLVILSFVLAVIVSVTIMASTGIVKLW